ncbi:hydroxyphenylacetyl-CoA thioesterase PaaI [Thalassiella azotivora]
MSEGAVAPWAARMWSEDVASRALGMELLHASGGRSVLRLRVRDDMVQGHGSCHGGMLFTLADSAFAFACNGPGETVVGASADITWVAPAQAGDVLLAVGEQETRYGRNGVTRVRITREPDGELVALFQGRSRALPSPSS